MTDLLAMTSIDPFPYAFADSKAQNVADMSEEEIWNVASEMGEWELNINLRVSKVGISTLIFSA